MFAHRVACYLRFHPLYRGTWIPTPQMEEVEAQKVAVSIRYIAVLGFQQYTLSMVPGAIKVSIRYIAVLGFQLVADKTSSQFLSARFHPLYRGTWIPTKRIRIRNHVC